MRLPICWCGGGVELYPAADPDKPPVAVCRESDYHDPLATGRPEVITTLYVAGPMSGHPENNYPAFHTASDALRSAGFTVVNPAEYSVPDGSRVHYTDLLREDLRQMLDCHGVATLDGWWASTGARNEVACAAVLGMEVRPVHDWLLEAARRDEDDQQCPHGYTHADLFCEVCKARHPHG